MGFLELLIHTSHIGIIGYWCINIVALIIDMVSGDVGLLDGIEEIGKGIAISALSVYVFHKFSKKVKSKKMTSNSVLRFAIMFVILDILSV